jgi:hypothetical protein
MKKIIGLVMMLFLVTIIGVVYANECAYILPRESQEAPFHKYDCITAYPILFGRITTEDASITDVNISIGTQSQVINPQTSNNYFFTNLQNQQSFSNIRMNIFPRNFISKFSIDEEEIIVRFPFSFFR